VSVEYLVFAVEGHGFTKKNHQIQGHSAVLKFPDRRLKGKPAGTR
jgi:dipeptidyl aminopeptidase/acylaminoacyl peptidase